MDLKWLLAALLWLGVTGADRYCTEFSRCVLLSQCGPLMSLLTAPRDKNVIQQLNYLNCGFEMSKPKVCCPSSDIKTAMEIIGRNACVKPDGEVGTCTKLEDCGYMYQQLRSDVLTPLENLEYLRKSKCTPPNKTKSTYVCCNPDVGGQSSSPPLKQDNRILGKCNSLSPIPPEPGSGCCGIEVSNEPKITGGEVTEIDQFPWVVLLDYDNPEVKCGGALISGQYVLTAAHCLTQRNAKPVSVRLGEYNSTNPGVDCIVVSGGGKDCTDGNVSVPIETYIAHHEYNPTKTLKAHDIGLIKLKNIVSYTEFIRPICLPTADFTISPPADMNLYVAGWGLTNSTLKTYSDVKLYARVSYKKCEPVIRNQLLGSQICAGQGNRDTCQGDSGGPLMLRNGNTYEAAAVSSFGAAQCGLEDFPSIYTKVYDYLGWINDNIKQ